MLARGLFADRRGAALRPGDLNVHRAKYRGCLRFRLGNQPRAGMSFRADRDAHPFGSKRRRRTNNGAKPNSGTHPRLLLPDRSNHGGTLNGLTLFRAASSRVITTSDMSEMTTSLRLFQAYWYCV
jgi:hypothetical protein